MYTLIVAIAQTLGTFYQNNLNLVSFANLRPGSTQADLVISTPPNAEASAASVASTLNTQLTAGASIGGLEISSSVSQVEVAQVDPTPTPTPTPEDDNTDETPVTPVTPDANLPLILGLSIPLGIIALVGLFMFMKVSSKGEGYQENAMTDSKLIHLDDI